MSIEVVKVLFLPANELKLSGNIDNGRKLFLKFGSVDSGGSVTLGHPKVFGDEPGALFTTIYISLAILPLP